MINYRSQLKSSLLKISTKSALFSSPSSLISVSIDRLISMWRRRKCKEVVQLGIGFCRCCKTSTSTSRWISSSSSEQQPRKGRFAALWGNGDFGRLGLGTLDSQWTPSVCTAFEDQTLRSISCGGAHTLFLTEAGRVYATGLNNFGQLGISADKSFTLGHGNDMDCFEPIMVNFGENVKVLDISCGFNHTGALLEYA